MSGPAASFGQVGQSQSQDCSLDAGTLFGVPIKVSYFLLIYFVGNVMEATKGQSKNVGWALAYAISAQLILFATVLCHEFGHGNMARYLGGEIDHILLWVFGGICFSTRIPSTDNRKLLRDDLLVVAAGPATHIFQTPIWALVLWAMFAAFTASHAALPSAETTGYSNAWEAFIAALNPIYGVGYYNVQETVGLWPALLWYFVGSAIRLNVALFLFNVFFPMYPADGSKLLVTSLMFCCGVAPRRAANVLLAVSVPCSALLNLHVSCRSSSHLKFSCLWLER